MTVDLSRESVLALAAKHREHAAMMGRAADVFAGADDRHGVAIAAAARQEAEDTAATLENLVAQRDAADAKAAATLTMIRARGTNRDYWEARAIKAEAERDTARADVARMRPLLLSRLGEALLLGWDAKEVIAALSPASPDDAWQDHRAVTDAAMGQWFLWRDPDDPDDGPWADRAIVEDGRIVGKWCCGLQFYRECAPLALPEDVAKIIADHEAALGAKEPGHE